MKGVLALLMISLPLLCQGQGNLVPNGGFEDLVECPWMTHQIQFASPWTNTNAGSPDIFNVCFVPNTFPPYNISGGVPSNSIGYQYPHSGDGYVGLYSFGGLNEPSSREYLQVQLTEPLQSGGYIISFWVSLADDVQYAVGSLGALFSDTLVVREDYNTILGPASTQSPAGIIMSNKDIWYHITDTFKSRYGGEQYLLIGNFKSTAESDTLLVPTGANNRFQSYYYIDDVSVVALDTVSGISDIERLQFSMYPNPVVGRVNIEAKERLNRIQLLGIRGRKIMAEDAIGQKHTLDLKSIPEGIYLLRVTDDAGRTATQRLVKLAEP